jgi:ribosomal-protein-alanine N-acetyltransferase
MVSVAQSNKTVSVPLPFSTLPPKIVETERLKIRGFESGDSELIFKTYTSDPVVSRYMSFPCAKSPEESRAFVAGVVANFAGAASEHQQYSWLIFRKDNGECIGSVGLGIKDATTIGGGYVLARTAWNQGFATEAWGALFEWAKSQPNVQRIEADHHPDNVGSGNVLRKVGLTCEGLVPKRGVLPNIGPDKVDLVVWAWNRSS